MAIEGSRLSRASQAVSKVTDRVLRLTNQVPPLPTVDADSQGNIITTDVLPTRRGQIVAYLDWDLEIIELYIAVDPNQDNTNFEWKRVEPVGTAYNSDTGQPWDPLWTWYRNTTDPFPEEV